MTPLFLAGPGSLRFDDTLDHAVSNGEIRTYRCSPLNIDQLISITLVWGDFEGSTLQNRLHLRVTDPSGSEHFAESENLMRNNVQEVEIGAAEAGVYTVEVDAVSISRGVPELPGLRQDFAFVVVNNGDLAMALCQACHVEAAMSPTARAERVVSAWAGWPASTGQNRLAVPRGWPVLSAGHGPMMTRCRRS